MVVEGCNDGVCFGGPVVVCAAGAACAIGLRRRQALPAIAFGVRRRGVLLPAIAFGLRRGVQRRRVLPAR